MRSFFNIVGLLFVSFVMLVSCVEKAPKEDLIVLDIPHLIQHSPTEVVEILGEPDTTYTLQILSRKILVQRYKKFDLEIQYLKGKSNDIIINDPLHIPFSPESLKYFGLKEATPTSFQENKAIKWKNYNGLKTIHFYKVQKDSTGNIVSYKIFFRA